MSKLMFRAGSFLTYSEDAGNCDAVVIVTTVECKLEKLSEIQEIKVMKVKVLAPISNGQIYFREQGDVKYGNGNRDK